MVELKCGKCGKMRILSADENGGKVVCPACGAIMPPPAWSLPAEAAPPRPPFPQIKKPAPPPAPHFAGAIVVVPTLIACTLALIGAAIWGRGGEAARPSTAPSPEAQLATQVAALKGEAESLLVSGELPAAHARYAKIEQLVAGKQVKDTALWTMIEDARQDDRQIRQLLLLKEERARANEALDLMQEAERLALAGQLQDSYEKYQQLERILATLAPNTLQPWVIEQAAQRQTRVFAMLTQSTQPQASPTTRPVAAAPKLQPATRPSAPLTRPVDIAPEPAATIPATRPVAVPEPGALPIRPIAIEAGLTDQQIDAAIQKAVAFLLAQFKGDQVYIEKKPNETFAEGLNALCVYSLLRAGQIIPDERLKPRDPAMRAMLERLKQQLMLADRTTPEAPVTYARSLRAAALSVYNRPEDRLVLEEDVRWLVQAACDGAYTYSDEPLKRAGAMRYESRPPLDGRTTPTGAGRIILVHNGESLTPAPPQPRVPVLPMVPMQPMMPGSRSYPDRAIESQGVDPREPPNLPWDNSNTQYGLFGVWCGAEAGVPVPPVYWLRAERHWLRSQLPTGEWCYNNLDPRPRFGMTVGGAASLLITHEYLDAAVFGATVGQESYSRWLMGALAWLENGDNSLAVNAAPVQYVGYNLFGLSRVGTQSGFKYFGAHDWYRELAAKILASQNRDGSWGEQGAANNIIETAYTTLFLCAGREPVIMNKLRFEGFWNNRARDLANLSKFASYEMERPTRWQIAPLQHDWQDWCDSPVLFIASHQAPKFKDEEIRKLRAFVDAGGLIFTHADGGAMAFNDAIPGLVRKLFPGYSLATLPASHPIYSLQYKLQPRFELKGVSNGARLLLVHAPKDLSTAWQVRDFNRRDMFEMGMNVFAYAAGKPSPRDRIALNVLPDVATQAVAEITVARLKHSADWDPEPSAWPRFARYLKAQIGWDLASAPMEIQQLPQQRPALAHLTGTSALSLTAEQAAALKTYVENGGVVLVDACGGSSAFVSSATVALQKLFPQARIGSLLPGHPLLAGQLPGMVELSKFVYRPYVEQKMGKTIPLVQVISAGRGMIIFSPLDLTEGLLGCPAWGILGFQPDYAQGFVRNVVVWTMQQSGRGRQ